MWISRVIRDQLADDSAKVLVSMDAANRYLPRDWEDVIIAPPLPRSSRRGLRHQLDRMATARESLDRVRERCVDATEVRILYSHLSEYVSNYLFFNTDAVLPNRPVTFVGLPDGILNYYPYTVGPSDLRKQVIKALLAPTKGLRFRPYRGLLTGFDRSRVEWQYALAPDLAVAASKAKPVELERLRRRVDGGAAWLILGQEPYADFIGADNFARLVRRQTEWVCERAGSQPVLYKPHHLGTGATPKPALKRLGVQVVEQDDPAEELVSQLGVSNVVAFTSSALMNLALLYGSSIRCFAVGYDDIVRALPDRGFSDLRARFLRWGVAIVDLP